ncbi:hypothetical protein [Pyrococcus yayanosii]|uniref:Uncharacterized protein n=1 Tax=Pyrococcus yayanosii (strain CH1 / JCM 16557) TaxID=529709 RepID=F8AGR7_PYRYC|nr:hypothetical protein [Pyrococcus yayanosii]AEH25203.1 hypothetical protein PYCH_15370 [Pyrococcus yayanosii CH1]
MKLVPSVAYLRIQRQAYIGYSMALAGWLGEALLEKGFPKPRFVRRALAKLGFSFSGENSDDSTVTLFYTKGSVALTASWNVEREALFLQLFPLRSRLSRGVTVRVEHIEFYEQDVVSIEPAQKLPPGIRSIGINPLILEEGVPVSLPYWGMLHEDWEEDLKILVMLDGVFERLRGEEYKCPVCFAPLRSAGDYLVCDRCGFVYTSETSFETTLEVIPLEESVFSL